MSGAYDVIDDLAVAHGCAPTFGFRLRMYVAAASRYFWERLAWMCPTAGGRRFCYARMGIHIGRDVFLGSQILFDKAFPERIRVGDHAVIGDRCMIFAHANLPSAGNELRASYPTTIKDVVIEDHVWMMPGCIVNPGVTIGRGSVVTTGAIVTASVPPRSFVAATPGRVMALPRELRSR